jgi:thiol-disulfide isomerase/thioredoxin
MPSKPATAKPAKSSPYLIDVRTLVALALSGLFAAMLVGFYLWMVRPAAAREAEAACNGLRPSPSTDALGTFPVAAPDFKVTSHDGKTVHLSDYRGKVVLVNYWASWCGVCEMEKPSVFRIADDLAGEDLVVLSLAADTDWAEVLVALSKAYAPDKVPDKFRKVPPDHPTMDEALAIYARALPNGTPFKVMLDDPSAGVGSIGKIAHSWGVEQVPDSFLVDRMGRIRYYFSNKRDWGSSIAETCIKSVIDE